MAAEEIGVLLDEAGAAIETESEALASDMTVEMDESMASLEWDGASMVLGEAEVAPVVADIGSSVVADVAPDIADELPSEIKDMVNRMVEGVPEGETGEELCKAGGKLSRARLQAQAAELASKAKTALSKLGSFTAEGLKVLGKIAMYGIGIGMALDFVGSKLGAIIQVDLNADDAPAWAQNMTDDQKADLQAVSDALPKLSVLIEGWLKQWETYQSSYVDLGEVTVKFNSTTQSIPVMYILFYAFQDMSTVITNTQSIFSGDTSTLTTADMILATNNIFIFLADALSMYDLKDQSDHLQTLDLPPDSDKETLTAITLTFTDGPDKVANVGVEYARFATQNAITSYLQVKIIQEIYRQLQDVVLPKMQEAAKTAYQTTAQDYMNDVKGDIIGLSLIPGVGVGLAQSKLETEQKTASEKGTDAAQKAAEKVLEELQPEVNEKALETVQQYSDEDQDQLKKIAELAMQDALGEMDATLQQ